MITIVDTSDRPDGELLKTVYAHFGLCMYLAQVFETGLINILTALETSASQSPTRETFDRLYDLHTTYTFGKLVKALAKHNFLPSELIDETIALKAERDHLAHHFFRDHDRDQLTIAGCHHMIEELEIKREKFSHLDERVSEYQATVFKNLGFDENTFHQITQKLMDEMLEEARNRYRSKMPKA